MYIFQFLHPSPFLTTPPPTQHHCQVQAPPSKVSDDFSDAVKFTIQIQQINKSYLLYMATTMMTLEN